MVDAGDGDETTGREIDTPRVSPYRPFDEQAREDFLTAIRTGTARSVAQACRLLMLNYPGVMRWIQLGKSEDYGDHDWHYKHFYLRYQQALTARANVGWRTLTMAAVEDPKAASELIRIQQSAEKLEMDREERALKAYIARREHEALHEAAKARAEAEAVRAKAEAEMAQIKTEIVRRGLKKVNGRVYFPQDLLALLSEDDVAQFGTLLERAGLLRATEAEVVDAQTGRDPREVEEMERLAEKWSMRGKRERAVDADTSGTSDATPPEAAPEARPAPDPSPSSVERVCVTGGPRTGKTTWALMHGVGTVRHTDDAIGSGDWSAASEIVVGWLGLPGPWTVEGVAVARALRKWLRSHPSGKPCDRVVVLSRPRAPLSKGQDAMAKGVDTVWRQVMPELVARGVVIEEVA